MGFRFRILKTWQFKELPTFHAIGLLEDGTISPPTAAEVEGHPGTMLSIESIAIGGGAPVSGNTNELTLVLKVPEFDPKVLEGKSLSSVSNLTCPT